MRRRVHLHGTFKKFHDGPIEIVANTVWDAVAAVTQQVKGFLPDPLMGRKRIQVAGFPTYESLKTPCDMEDIHIWPAMIFGKNGGVINTIIGVALVVVGVLVSPIPGFQLIGTALVSAGIGMVIGGVLQLSGLSPSLNGSDEPQIRSRYLPAVQNTVRIGTPIGLLYGRGRVGGQLMSLNVDAKDATT
jgi:predicted phage tail protein